MPTERFFHLPDEKKKMIREAAVKEFCRVPIEKASINKIVQNAEISRGSFYTYFKDKEDVLDYIFEDVVSQIQNFCKDFLLQTKGEFWELPRKMLDYTIEICETNKMFALAQGNSKSRVISLLLEKRDDLGHCQESINLWVKELYHLTDCSKLLVNNFNDFWDLFSLCTTNMVMTIGEIYQRGRDEEEAKRSFERRLDLIKHGAARNINK